MKPIFKSLLVLSIASLSSVAAHAATCRDLEAKGKIGYNDTCKNARANDIADAYVLDGKGNFFRFVRGAKCQITNGVESFKVSQHKDDAAVAYFEKNHDLVVLHNPKGEELDKSCPAASKKTIMSDVSKYNVVSNTNTTIVNMAVSRSGQFTAWDNDRAVAQFSGVEEYKLNECYGSKGKSFNTYVAFLIGSDGTVLKLKGLNPSESKFDRQTYYSIEAFQDKNRVCKEMNE